MVGPAGLDAVCADAVDCSGGFVKGPVEREEANGSGELGCGIAEGLAVLAEVVVPREVRGVSCCLVVKELGTYLSAITTSCVWSSDMTFFTKTGAAFLTCTSSLWVCPNPNICANATDTAVLDRKSVV